MVRETTDRSAWLGRLLVLAAAVVVGWQLMLPPVVGVADNGDFGKLLGRFGLGSGQTFEYANTEFFFSHRYRYHSGFNSSELLLIAPAVALAHGGSVDLRTIGAIHAALFLLAVLLFIPLAGWTLGALALLLFCDFLYVGYFNSFYMDVAALLFTILAAVFYLRAMRGRRPADSIALLISAILATASKPHYAFLGLWFAVLFWMARDVLCAGRKAVAAAASAVLILTAWASFRFLAPADYAAKGCFTVIFTQILPHSADPDGALRDLGLDASYRKWSGLQAYSPGSPVEEPAFSQLFLKKTSYRKIARFYLTHPRDAWLAFRSALDEAGRFRSPLGNFDSHSGRPPAAQYESFSGASHLKQRLFHHHGARLFFAFAGLSMVTLVLLLRARPTLPAGAFRGVIILILMAATTLVVSALADVYDQPRHQLLFFAQCDMLLLVGCRLISWVRGVSVADERARPQPLAHSAGLRQVSPLMRSNLCECRAQSQLY